MTALDWTLLAAFVLSNIVAFVLMGSDKWKARRGSPSRTPEATLLLWCVCCGAWGGWLGMQVFRHKTRHRKFTFTVPVLMLAQIALATVYIVYWR